MKPSARYWLAIAAACTCGCARPAAPPDTASGERADTPARLAVEVYGGLEPTASDPTPDRVELVVDLTRSMTAGAGARIERARSGALALARSLPARTQLALRGLGQRDGASCTQSERLLAHTVPADDTLAERLRSAAPRSEASLAATLDEVGADLAREGEARGTRVVVFSDLGADCGGDLCEAAQRLVARGAWLQVVPVGDAAPPACLAELLPSPAPPPGEAGTDAPAPPFLVIAQPDPSQRARVVAVGRAGNEAIPVPPGLVTLIVQLDPPETIGPFRLEPGGGARVRVLDVPGTPSPARTWRIERGNEAVGRAFPPPEKLPTARNP